MTYLFKKIKILPENLQCHIFEYDKTYHEIYKSVVDEIQPLKILACKAYIHSFMDITQCTIEDNTDNTYSISIPESDTDSDDSSGIDDDEEYAKLLIVTNNEAVKCAKIEIKKSLYNLPWSFIVDYLTIYMPESVYLTLQDYCQDYEELNDYLIDNIENIDLIVSDALQHFGRGYFLDNYNGHGTEVRINNFRFYVYRLI
jgi:hypothetical protein